MLSLLPSLVPPPSRPGVVVFPQGPGLPDFPDAVDPAEKGIWVFLATIHVPTAAASLENRFGQRNVNQGNLRRLMSDVDGDAWVVTGETVIYSEDGWLLNGQHRMEAIVATGKPITTLVVVLPYDMAREAMGQIDHGLPRSTADSLRMDGEPNAVPLAAVLDVLFFFDRHNKLAGNMTRPSRSERAEVLERYPSARDAVAYIGKRFEVGIPPRYLTALRTLTMLGLPEQSEVFFERLRTGVGLEEKDPVLVLRRQLDRKNRSWGKGKMDVLMEIKVAWLIRAWNLHVEGRRTSVLRVDSQPPVPLLTEFL